MAFNPTDEELKRCQRWLKYILVPFSQSADTNSNYLDDTWLRNTTSKACQQIMHVIKDRIFDMAVGGETDQAFDLLSKQKYKIDPNGYSDDTNTYKISVALMTGFLAYICATKHIFWEDQKHSEYEVNYFKQTKLGKAL